MANLLIQNPPNYTKIYPNLGYTGSKSELQFPEKIQSKIQSKKSNKKSSRNTRFTRVSLRAGGITELFEIAQKTNQNQIKEKIKICSTRQFMRWSILLVSIYNILFIPLQFGYRIKFDGLFLVMELFTIILYCFDIKFRMQNLKLLQSVGGNLPDSENLNEQKLMGDKD